MADTPQHIVIVGAGLAAANAVETLRAEGYPGSLTLVGREPHLPYERPQLSKSVLKGEEEFSLLHEQDWYDERDVRVLLGTEAVAIDTGLRMVTLDSGEALPYDRLLLATGATPRTLPLPGAENAVVLRTVDDGLALKAAIAPGTRVALIGGGWIGLEVAAGVVALGGQAVVLEMAERPLGGVLGPDLADYLAALHRSHGVEIRTGVTVQAIEPGGVRTSDGLVPADVVVVAVGAAPDTTLADASGIAIASREDGGGILADSRLRTSAPEVYAAGDVANAENTALGRLRVEHWDNAIRQGQLAAKAMLGQDVAYDWLPYFYTDQFEFGMEYVGRSAPDDEVVVRGNQDAHEFIAYWLRDGRITAAMNVGIWDVNDQLRALVGTEATPDTLTDLQ
jgi:3-phenylpropionate/trans-cinnamate dioxygenase ferredoxin reductase subunit